MVDALANLLLAALFGGMVFFPAVVAPLVFRTLDEASAGRFLRALFPRYYAFMIATAGAAGLLVLFAAEESWRALVLLSIAASTLAVRQLLVPRLNAWRDAELAGDAAAARRFAIGHRASVLVNVAQLAGTLVVLVAPA